MSYGGDAERLAWLYRRTALDAKIMQVSAERAVPETEEKPTPAQLGGTRGSGLRGVARLSRRRGKMGRLVKVAETKDVPPGTALAVDLEGHKIAVFNAGGTYYAIDDTCTHRGGPLSEGGVEGTVVTCPWHGATYDITTGNVLGPPARQGVASYQVRIDVNDVAIEIS